MSTTSQRVRGKLIGVSVALAIGALGLTGLVLTGCQGEPRPAAPKSAAGGPVAPHVQAASVIEAGRYLVMTVGCNDCHTNNYLFSGGNVPEEQWLLGSPVGWRGPWGTTYASNLRLFLKDFDEETFIKVVRARNTRPPMPWWGLHEMSDSDLRSIFRYVRSLPVKGEKMPLFVPPDQEPTTPAILLVPQPPKQTADGR